MKITRTRVAIVGAALTLALTGASCSSDSDSASSADKTTSTMADSASSMPDESMPDESSTMPKGTDMSGPTGPACSAVPADGAGSFDGMAEQPVATAASGNPLLSTLVSAVDKAGLVDTLNGPGPFTVFAPVNDAFAAIPADDLNAVLADNDQLTKILTYHVVPGQMSSGDLIKAGSVETVEGDDLTIEKSGDSFTVNGAKVLCADVQTANATVFLIDTVMMPG